jgi:hypothetical protein
MLNRRNVWYDERPMHITAQPQKRDATICPTSYSLCPASVGGGCCPTDLSCGSSSCYPTTAAPPAQCANSPGLIACGLDQGGRNAPPYLFLSKLTSTGGCCPSGYSCVRSGCFPLSGSTYSQACDVGSYLCPTSLGLGCCHDNFACGLGGNCYPTSFSTVPVTITYTTTISNSITQTITTVVQTAYSESVAQAPATTAAVSPLITKSTPSATAVAKVQASDSPSNGLSTAQVGGIIGAAVGVVIVVCVATFLIIRRLNAVSREAKAAATRKSLSNSNTKSSGRPRPHRPTGGYSGLGIENIENMSIDPLMMSDSDTNAAHSSVGLPRPSAVYSTRSELEHTVSPPIPAPYGSPQAYTGGYQAVPTSEHQYPDSSGHRRNQSADSPNRSRSPRRGGATGYFDMDPTLRDQNLRHGHASPRPSVQSHGRQWSDASDVSQQSGSSGLVELDATQEGDRRSSLQRAMQGVGFSRMTSNRRSVDRRRSSSGGATPARRDVGAAPGMSQRLENVVEAELDSRERSVGPAVSESSERTAPKAKTTYQSQFHEMGISAMGPSETELERLEQQKVIGNLGDLRRDQR